MQHLWEISSERHGQDMLGGESARFEVMAAVRAAFHPTLYFVSVEHLREYWTAANAANPHRYLPVDWAWTDGLHAVDVAESYGIDSDEFLAMLMWDTLAQRPTSWYCAVSCANEQEPRALFEECGQLVAQRWQA